MTRFEELLARLEVPVSEPELTRMARVAAAAPRVPPAKRRSARRIAAIGAAVATIAAGAAAGSMLHATHAPTVRSESVGWSGPYFQYSALAVLEDGR